MRKANKTDKHGRLAAPIDADSQEAPADPYLRNWQKKDKAELGADKVEIADLKTNDEKSCQRSGWFKKMGGANT